MRTYILTFALALATASAAHAEPGGTSSVSGPTVTQGQAEFEFRTATFLGDALDRDWSHRVQAGYGVTAWWRPTLILRASDPADDSLELSSVALEHRIDFTATRDWPVHFGANLHYKHDLNDSADSVEVKLLAEHNAGPMRLRLNLEAEREVGAGAAAEWEHAYAAYAMWRVSDQLRLGAEVFGEPEAHAHYLGPRAQFSLGETTIALAYLHGLDEAQTNGQFRLAIELDR